jgi:hypothetical protein
MRRCLPFIISKDGAIAKWFAISRASKSEIRLGIFRISFDISIWNKRLCDVAGAGRTALSRADWVCDTRFHQEMLLKPLITTLKRLLCIFFGYIHRLQEIMWFFCIWHIRCSCFRFVTNMHTNFDILKSDLCFWKHILKSYELSINLARSMVLINNKICLASHEFYPSNSRQAWFIQSDGTGLCTAH